MLVGWGTVPHTAVLFPSTHVLAPTSGRATISTRRGWYVSPSRSAQIAFKRSKLMYPVLLQTPDNASGSHFMCSQKENNSNPQSYPLVNQLCIFSIKGYPAPDARRATSHLTSNIVNTLLGLISVSAGFIPTHVKAPYDQTCYRRPCLAFRRSMTEKYLRVSREGVLLAHQGRNIYIMYADGSFVWSCHVIGQSIWPKKPMR